MSRSTGTECDRALLDTASSVVCDVHGGLAVSLLVETADPASAFSDGASGRRRR